ncbi:TetR/AcrR family transcriptional regulator [Dyella flava]|uniref:TetR/AcrR family transcriptional regulator n=1 Tax=Dyella flava TaxID=1920170 RepID=A0ABS2K627_9GAMM|nr:TetR/AcrR family transcriptional regulator [Dyella flava]MBM7126160.1 TetR/AcrR family transcriptional regulator [Dyella flava]GLQ49034.1 TetR family transcriptional regulator [Dyella flava]
MVTRNADNPAAPPEPPARRPGRPSGSVNGLEQRNRLLDTALQLFSRQGIVETPLSAIAHEAGVTPAMLHYYFKTRDQLLDVLIEERIQPRRAAISKIFDANAGDPVTIITRLVEGVMKAATEDPWFPAFWMREVFSDNGVLRQRIQQRYGSLHQQSVLDCIARWQAEGRLNRDFEPSLLFMTIFGLTILPLIATKTWQNDPLRSKLGPADIARHAIAILSGGVSPKP